MKSLKKYSLVFILFFLSVFLYIQQAQEEQPVKIPKEVAQVIEANLEMREARLDIPLSYVNTLYFPYQSEYFAVFFLELKNKDIGYEAPVLEKKKQEEKVEEEETILSCNADFFFRIYSLGKDGQVKKIHKEIYLPFADQAESSKYDPEEEGTYSFGTLFPPGRYLLSVAVASLDLTRIGLIFREFYLPEPSDFKKKLGVTPLFFAKSLKRMPTSDSEINLYKNFFHYATLEVEPLFDHEFSLTEKLDLLFFIMGGIPAEDGTYSFEVSYIYRKGEEEVVKFEPRTLDIPAPIVSQPLPLEFADKKLEPGEYILEINLKDNIGKKEGTEKISFFIKQEEGNGSNLKE